MAKGPKFRKTSSTRDTCLRLLGNVGGLLAAEATCGRFATAAEFASAEFDKWKRCGAEFNAELAAAEET